jgi:hypothetical protein
MSRAPFGMPAVPESNNFSCNPFLMCILLVLALVCVARGLLFAGIYLYCAQRNISKLKVSIRATAGGRL